jgi:hypothetical protein
LFQNGEVAVVGGHFPGVAGIEWIWIAVGTSVATLFETEKECSENCSSLFVDDNTQWLKEGFGGKIE